MTIRNVFDFLFNIFTFCVGMVAIVLILAISIPYAVFCCGVESVKAICGLMIDLFKITVEVSFGKTYGGAVDVSVPMDDLREPLTQDEVMNLANANPPPSQYYEGDEKCPFNAEFTSVAMPHEMFVEGAKLMQEKRDEQFESHLDHASDIVSKWPEWKRNVLRDSGKSTVDVPRAPVSNSDAY